jgi:hypothetical protein
MIIQILGWVGMVVIVLAHYLVSTKKISGISKRYHLLNIVGSVLVGLSVIQTRSWPALALQIAWILIALYAISKRLISSK